MSETVEAPVREKPAIPEVVSFAFKHPVTGKVNEPQAKFHDNVMKAALMPKENLYRFFWYGGAIRGGKTFVCLYLLVRLACLFPRSRWHIFRSDFPELEDTTIPSMEKLIGTEGKFFRWNRKSSNYHVRFANGSRIFFKSENKMKDPELKWMLGLETNGIVLEQMEGVSEKLLDRSIERLGSWVIPKMPPPILMGTFNPTDTWVKKKIYDKFVNGTLPEGQFFQQALPDDNPYVTEEQWKNWQNLDPISKAQLIKGIWRFNADAKLFAYAYNEDKHKVDVQTPEGKAFMTPVKGLPLKFIFDFNVDPMTCLVAQNDGLKWVKVYKEYRLRNSNIYELLERINTDWPASEWFRVATGDASGRNKSALTRGKRTYVTTIQTEMKLGARGSQFPSANPSVANTRVLMNSLFHNHPAVWISSDCLFLNEDLATVKVDDKGEIEKGKDKLKTHLLDNLRYLFWNYMRQWLKTTS